MEAGKTSGKVVGSRRKKDETGLSEDRGKPRGSGRISRVQLWRDFS